METVDWIWPTADLGGGADGSVMSKLFRGQSLSDTALLAREAVQNSSDAAMRFQQQNPDVPFRVVFRFVSLFGDEKADAIEALDLKGMRERRAEYAKHSKDPLQSGNALDSLDDPTQALRLLYVEDYGTHGLYGDPSIFQESHLFMAMYYIGASTKAADAGGSYGFGKSALERASRTHSVIAHTTFEQHDDDPVRTRLVGFTWWPNLQVGKTMYNGRASFSNHHAAGPALQTVATPFSDQDANLVANRLGFQPRDPDKLDELGTSFLIVDPAIEPAELLTELEKWWWPALEEHRLDVEVILPSGETKVPKPAGNPFVAQFLRAFRIATKLDEPGDPNCERLASKNWRNRSGSGGQDLGSLALVVPDGTPVDEDGEETESTPLVALIRGPRMVIRYESYTRRRVALRGVFVASDKANVLLRDTEPSSHDRWTTNTAGDLSQEAIEVARAVMTKIRTSVTDMAKAIAPPPPKRNQSLGHFSRLMLGFMGSKRGPTNPPPAGGERIELQFPEGRPAPEVLDDDQVRVKTKFTVRVADAAERSACEARVACQLYIFEDESQSQSKWPVKVRPVGKQHSFVQEDDGSWRGVISKIDRITFVAESDPYPNLWTISMQPTVQRVSDWSAQ
ncbi:hypothetical protein [Kocuria rhizosphaericola]|uniref:hypothetical protein n=1 Tax=Kocuria rhizosphaericola TaxID=3376284 RepID=UPI00379BBE50